MATKKLAGLTLAAAALAAGTVFNVQVRDGFVLVYDEKITQKDRTNGDERTIVREQRYYPEDGEIKLSAEQVRDHAHKLEPADDDAAAFLEALHAKYEQAPGAAAAAPVDPQAVATATAAAMVKALQDAGVIVPAAAAKPAAT